MRTGDEITIRQVQPDDGPSFRAIRLKAVAESPGAFGSSLAELRARPKQYWDQRPASAAAGIDNVLFVAECAGDWVGIAGAYADGDIVGGNVDLISMWVHPSYRRHGIGRTLVERIVAWARSRGVRQIELSVKQGNDGAARLYADCDFRDTGERQVLPSHAGMVEARMVMELSQRGE